MNGKGIVFNKSTGRYETDWGWIAFRFDAGTVEVHGPAVDEWFDSDKALNTAALFSAYCPNPGMAIAIAIHYQYAAWKGAKQLEMAS